MASIPKGMVPAEWSQVVWGATGAVTILALTLLLLRREGRAPRDCGLTLTGSSALLFGAAALASRGLAMPIGLHAALNIASWSVGEKAAPGFWTMAVAESSRNRVAAVAPIIGVGITAAATIVLWRWTVRRVPPAQVSAA